MHLAGIPANNIHWLREFQLSTVGVSYPTLSSFSARDRASGRGVGCSELEGDSLIYIVSCVETTCVQSAYLASYPVPISILTFVERGISPMNESQNGNRDWVRGYQPTSLTSVPLVVGNCEIARFVFILCNVWSTLHLHSLVCRDYMCIVSLPVSLLFC